MPTKTYSPRAAEVQRRWHVIDAAGRPLGQVATQAAVLLHGKHKPMFSPSLDVGDYVVVINAAQVAVSGRKMDDKLYHRHSGYPGGLRTIRLRDLMAKFPERVIEAAVRGMLPKNRLGRAQYRHLRVYAGPEHPHAGQMAVAPPTEGDR